VQRWIIVFLVLGGAVIGARYIAAQAQSCAGAQCVYLPALNGSNGPTITPTATLAATWTPVTFGPTPDPGFPCDRGAPGPVEGAQAWVNYEPIPHDSPYTTPVLCIRMVADGQFVAGFTAQVVVHGATRDGVLSVSNSASGVAYVNLQSANADYVIGKVTQLDVAIPYLDRIAVFHTTFVPPVEPSATPTITLTPAPSQTSTSTPTFTPTPTP
jgi:hypothetical protein